MNHKTLKTKKYQTEYKLRILLQEINPDSEFWNYLYELYNRLLEKGWLFPSEYKKVEQWEENVNVYY